MTVAVPRDGHVRVVEEFDYERRHPSRQGDERDLSACPGQGHVEGTAFLGVRKGFGYRYGPNGGRGSSAMLLGNPYVPLVMPGSTM